jgi:hypothetical protein
VLASGFARTAWHEGAFLRVPTQLGTILDKQWPAKAGSEISQSYQSRIASS